MTSPARLVDLAFTLVFATLARAQSAAAEAPKSPAWVTTEMKAPRASFQTFDSAAAKAKASYHRYTRAPYERETEGQTLGVRFPVAYWLRGSGGGAAGSRNSRSSSTMRIKRARRIPAPTSLRDATSRSLGA
jgi:hypothetical protein